MCSSTYSGINSMEFITLAAVPDRSKSKVAKYRSLQLASPLRELTCRMRSECYFISPKVIAKQRFKKSTGVQFKQFLKISQLKIIDFVLIEKLDVNISVLSHRCLVFACLLASLLQGRLKQWTHWARAQGPRILFLFEGPPAGCGEINFLN